MDTLISGTSLGILYKDDVIKKAVEALDGVTVIYGGADKLLKSKTAVKMKTPYVSGTVYIPCGFFKDKLIDLPKTYIEGAEYYPAAEALKKSGMCVVSDGRFIAAAKDGSIDIFKRKGGIGVNEYREIAAYLVKHNMVDFNTVSKDVCKTICKRWAFNLVGNESVNDINDLHIQKIIKDTDNDAENALKLFTRNGDALFKGNYSVNMIDVSMSSWYKYLLCMAKAFGTYGCTLYHDKKLLDDILYGLKWMYDNKYGRDKITNDGWGMISKLGWYEWAIASPAAMISVMMIVEEYLTKQQKEDYTAFFDSLRDKPYGVGYNCLDFGRLMIGSAALKDDVKKIVRLQFELEAPFAFVDNNREFSIETFLDKKRAEYTETKGQGFYTDGSYVYHTLHGLNGMYGISHLEKTAEYLSLFQKTPLEITTPMVDNVPYRIYNSFAPLIYHTAMFRTVQGRTNFPDCYVVGKRVVLACLQLIDFLDSDDAAKVKRLVKHHAANTPDLDFYAGMKIAYVKKFNEIINDTNIEEPTEEESRMFYHMDKAVHKRKDWAFCVSMSSSRIFNYDSICNEGMKNWYMGDGMTEYHIKDSFRNGSLDYWNYINYYKLPGITADTQPRKEVSIAQGNEYLSSKSFVGGVTLGGRFGVSAMELESYHNESDYGNEYDPSIGCKAPAHKCDLTAKKAWFMFDNEVVCLGADISASDNNNAEVITVVDNYMLDNNKFYADGQEYDGEYCGKTSWALLEGACGYYFPKGERLYKRRAVNSYSGWTGGDAAKKMQRGRSFDFAELWLSHGVNPKDGKYQYVILPGITKKEIISYTDNPCVFVLENSGSVQAVRNIKSNVTGYVFWKSGAFDGVFVDNPIIAARQMCKNDVRFAFADPTQKLKTAKVTVDGLFCAVQTDEAATVYADRGKTVIEINFEGSRGRSIEVLLKA